MPQTALRLLIEGRVQGVSFRAWTVAEARRLDLTGWVRNRRDGSVEVLAIGDEVAIETLAELCARGPPAAQVTAVRRFPDEDDGSKYFQQRATC